MTTNEYHFITEWRVKATVQEVYDIIADAKSLPRWWPSVYLDVREVSPGDKNSIGKRVYLYTKGWLPYTLKWHFVVTENIAPETMAIRAFGDFEGRGIWIFSAEGENCYVLFDWKIAATKPLIRSLSWLFKPLFSLNHKWAMRRGLQSLKLEIQRRRAVTPEELERIPAPPPPTFPHNFTNNKKLDFETITA
jgi:Polyketide cyclase / dehydrase and lipid transport